MSVLGSMMLNREATAMVLPIIAHQEADRFYRPDHRRLFEALVDIYDENKPMDLVVVRDELKRRPGHDGGPNLLDEIGGVPYLVQLVDSVATWVNVEHHARIVRDKALLRELIYCAGEITRDAYTDSGSTRELLDEAERRVFAVTEQRVSNKPASLQELLVEVYAQIESTDGSHISGVPTGFFELDDLLSGLQPSELIIVAARPSMGKTAFGLGIAEHISIDEGKPVAFFSMEMSRRQVAQRVLCSRGHLDSHRLRRGMLTEDEIRDLSGLCDELGHVPFYVDDTADMTVLELRAKARRLSMQYQIQAVFVDYLQLMHTPRVESRQQEIAVISRGLKGLARELNIPIVALAQLNRAAEAREGHRPRMADLRESGAIEQDADVVLLIHREEYFKPEDPDVQGLAEIIVAKQRNGPVGTVKLQFNKNQTRFTNLFQGVMAGAEAHATPGPYDPLA